MNDNHRERPDLYDWLDRANAADRLTFRRAYRRRHPVLATIAWFAESNWRMAGFILAALLLGSLLEWILP